MKGKEFGMDKEKNSFFKKLIKISKDFRHYFWIGILLILLSLFLQVYYKQYYAVNILFKIVVILLQTLGISMFIASLFSFVVDSYSFQEKLRKLVEDIVLKRDFLNELPLERKKEALQYLIKPSESEIEKYSNIDDFYKYFVNEILDVSKKNIRSNYNINLIVKYDSNNKKVYSDGIYSYRLYPSENGYTDILIGFKKDDKESYVKDLIINFPNGKRKKFSRNEIEKLYKEDDIARKANIKINDFCKEYHHVDIELKVKEYGKNHWINVFFKAEQATDGFKMNLICEDELEIKEYLLFDVGKNYHIELMDNKREFNISCYQWVSEGAGISLIVSKPECSEK